MDIGLEIKNLNNMIHRHFTNLKTTEILNKLTGSNGYIIVYLMEHQNELITQKQIEEVLGITRSTASIVLSHMEENQLITRKILEQDSRIKSIHIMPKGMELYETMTREKIEFEAKLLQGFTSFELDQFVEYIRRMKKNIKEELK
ncbi:MAG: MarR family transcriptional regulator [Acholeplasmatales bacterium]|jgi:DNA-binding MarR family transcriptional regulator|nr:MarR family transcriptional regulator [Acholeplasmatales bacterium]